MIMTLRNSFIECNGRERAIALLGEESYRELLGPFDGFESPHLEPQGIVPQSDDGVIIAKGDLHGHSAVIISLEGAFQGGGIGEVSGAKIAGALEMVLKDNEAGVRTYPIIIFDTGGVRLQEANYGLLSIAEIGSAIIALRPHVPVVGIVPGKIGAYGGMSITAGLCDAIIMTREGRLSMNGPEVIEQEAGIQEFDSKDRQHIWATSGGEQRVASGFADIIAEDDVEAMREAIVSIIEGEVKVSPKSSEVDRFLSLLQSVDPSKPLSSIDARELWLQSNEDNLDERHALPETENVSSTGRGTTWFNLLAKGSEDVGVFPSVRCADALINDRRVRYIAVVPDSANRFPRARNGEVGLLEGWTIAKHVRDAIEEDQHGAKRTIIAIVDVPSQAFGYREELLGIHQSCAGAVDAYASARLAGHPVIAFIPGNAISGAFLSHGLQANRLLALNDEGVLVHVMSKQSAARITQRSIEELEKATEKVPSMSYDIESFEKLGALHELISGVNADAPKDKDRQIIYDKITEAITDIESNPRDLSSRLTSQIAQDGGRVASILVRKKLTEQW